MSDALGFSNPAYRFSFNASNYLDADGNDIDDDGNDWVLLNGTDTMTPGVGYAATHSTIGFIPGLGYDYVFRGPFNTGTINSPIVYNAANLNHWNLVGNPYPSAIDIDDFFTDNSNQNDVVYMWSHYRPPLAANPGNQVLNFNQSDYVVINLTGETGNGSDLNGDGSINGLDIPDRFIPSGQSFFIASNNNGASVTFNNGMRMADGVSNTQFFSPNPEGLGVSFSSDESSSGESNKLWINMMSDNGAYNQLMVGYVPNATDGFDGISYDAKRQMSTGNAAIIYTMIEDGLDQKFQIEGKSQSSLTTEEVIPLGFDTTIEMATLYTISNIKTEGPFFDEHKVYLKDNYLNSLHELSESDYQFTSGVGEFRDRFEIVFTGEALNTDDPDLTGSDVIIYEDRFDHFNIKLPDTEAIKAVEVIDLLGRRVLQISNLNSSEHRFDASPLSQATYIIRVTASDGEMIQKKLVKR